MHYCSSVVFFNTKFSPVKRIYLILNSIYTYQLNTLIETVEILNVEIAMVHHEKIR